MHGWRRSAAPRPRSLLLLLIVLGMVFIAAANTKYFRLSTNDGSWWTNTNNTNGHEVSRIELGHYFVDGDGAVNMGISLDTLSSPSTQRPTTAPPSTSPTATTSPAAPLSALPQPFAPAVHFTAPTTNLDNCELINEMLALLAANRTNEPNFSNHGLPQPYKPNESGAIFYCKTPLVRTLVNDKPVILLEYSKAIKYKFDHAISLLTQYGKQNPQTGSALFPELVAHCSLTEGKKRSYVVEEYLPLLPNRLPRPRNLTECVARLKKVMHTYVTLDEDLHMTLIDAKQGQWMARTVDEFVLQDVDDIVLCPTKPPYSDMFFKRRPVIVKLASKQLPKNFTRQQVEAWVDDRIFPRGPTIRFTMMMLSTFLMKDLGLASWSKACHGPGAVAFYWCVQSVFRWAETPYDDWPAPRQVVAAIDECNVKGAFTRTRRKRAEWRDGF